MAGEITVQTRRTLKLADLAAVAALGVVPESFATLNYTRTPEIADAADFIKSDGIITLISRLPCHNLVFFTYKFVPTDLSMCRAKT